MASNLDFARISYGRSTYAVRPGDFVPIPKSIDPNAPDFLDTVRSIFAMMSNASGGHPCIRCKVSVWNESVNLTAEGVHVFYKNPNARKFDIKNDPAEIAEFAAMINRNRLVIELGRVDTDQYGDGWKRAKWSAA